MDSARTIEAAFAVVLKGRAFRKRGRNWFRTTEAGEYQVVNLQRSSWGGGFYLNLGWHPAVAPGEFVPAHRCALTLRAEHTDVIPTVRQSRASGVSEVELPGISLLDAGAETATAPGDLAAQVTEVVAVPVADLLDRTPSVVDLVPLLTAKPWFVRASLRDHLSQRGYELPDSR